MADEKKKYELKYEASCANCAYWHDLKKAKPDDHPNLRQGMCRGKFGGDYVTANQYCLGYKKRGTISVHSVKAAEREKTKHTLPSK